MLTHLYTQRSHHHNTAYEDDDDYNDDDDVDDDGYAAFMINARFMKHDKTVCASLCVECCLLVLRARINKTRDE